MSIACLQAANAGGAVRGGDRDADGGLADLDDAGAVPDRGAQAAVIGERRARDAHDLLLGHARVGLVLEVEHLALARALAHGAREGRDRAGVRAADVRDQAAEVDRLGAEQDERLVGAARDGRDQRDLVAVAERDGALGVLLVDGVGEPARLGADGERGEDVAGGGAGRQLELALPRARALPQSGEEPHGHAHGGLTP